MLCFGIRIDIIKYKIYTTIITSILNPRLSADCSLIYSIDTTALLNSSFYFVKAFIYIYGVSGDSICGFGNADPDRFDIIAFRRELTNEA